MRQKEKQNCIKTCVFHYLFALIYLQNKKKTCVFIIFLQKDHMHIYIYIKDNMQIYNIICIHI